jgi:hypothetical protein
MYEAKYVRQNKLNLTTRERCQYAIVLQNRNIKGTKAITNS